MANSRKKKILFISANDFKEKSIQVIRKTPEAYVERGWEVHYLVCRDKSKHGNYFYEKEINPKGVKVYRFSKPLQKVFDLIKNNTVRTVFNKIIMFFLVLKFAWMGIRILRKNPEISVVYGYEVAGVLASRLMKIFKRNLDLKYVHRYMGTWLAHYLQNNNKLKLLLNFEAIWAFKLKSDLCIMTNDGTQGDKVYRRYNKNSSNFKFWINGVDAQFVENDVVEKLRNKYGIVDEKIFLSVSRLQGWKRVDRAIEIISRVKNDNIKYFIVGDGSDKEKLELLGRKLGVEDKIIFVGSIPNNKVKEYLNMANFFFSFYDLSNVGNPLLESLRANKIIFTLNNGDTKSWIQHKRNGFIYEINEDLYDVVAADIDALLQNNDMENELLKNIKDTANRKLWNWKERMDAEVTETEKLIFLNKL